MDMNNIVVTIPIQRYEQLLDIETRANVLVDMICSEKAIRTTSILRILATDEALMELEKINKESEEEKDES